MIRKPPARSTNYGYYAAYRAWLAADDAWQAALVAAFGKDACNRRYDADRSDHPEACQVAHRALAMAKAKYKSY